MSRRPARFVALILLMFLIVNVPCAQDEKSRNMKHSLPIFKVDVDTVFLNVSVMDFWNRYIIGLEKEHFIVYEDKVVQTISHFVQNKAPLSLGIVFDFSSSMEDDNRIREAKEAFRRLLDSGIPGDECLLITFNQTVTLVKDFTDDSSSLPNDIALKKPDGNTALFDAVYMGLEEVRKGKNERKALIIISDGENNRSRYTAVDVREFAAESDVQIYAIVQRGRLGYGLGVLQNITTLTGGRAFLPRYSEELDYYIDLIHAELRNQYVIGYVPSNKTHDGKWRNIVVRLLTPPGLTRLSIRTRRGYFAAKE